MSKTTRSTRACPPSQLQPALRRALQEYLQTHKLGDLETECQACCETMAVTISDNGFRDRLNSVKEKTSYTAIVLTARELVWAWAEEGHEARVVGANLAYIEARMSNSLFTKEVGLKVAGLVGASKGNVRGVIGLGPEPEAREFCEQVRLAIEKANPGVKRKWPSWMGGGRE